MIQFAPKTPRHREVIMQAALERLTSIAGSAVDAGQEVHAETVLETAADALREAEDEHETSPVADAADILALAAHSAALAAGWWTDAYTIGADGKAVVAPYYAGTQFGLIHSEVSEAMEGHRTGDMDKHLPHRPKVEVQLADVIIRAANLAGGLGLDLGGALAEKMAFNKTRADHRPEVRKMAGGKAY